MSIIQYMNECCLYSPIPSTQEAEENLYILFTHVDYVKYFLCYLPILPYYVTSDFGLNSILVRITIVLKDSMPVSLISS